MKEKLMVKVAHATGILHALAKKFELFSGTLHRG
jgi:hypothetical protein